jgi:hypothetical protein
MQAHNKLADMIVTSIAQAIEKCSKTRYQISRETGIDQAILCRIVNGGTCGLRTADKLCEYLGLELRPRQAKGM